MKGSSRRGSAAVVEKGSSLNPVHPQFLLRSGRKHWIALGTFACACAVMAIGWTVGQHMGPVGAGGGINAARASAAAGQVVRPVHTEREMSDLVALLSQTLPVSRAVLLGSRDPRGPSCVSVVKTGDLHGERPSSMGDCNGGPGGRTLGVHCRSRVLQAGQGHVGE